MLFIRKLLTQAILKAKPLAKIAALPVIADIPPRGIDGDSPYRFGSNTLELYFNCIKKMGKNHPACEALKEKLENSTKAYRSANHYYGSTGGFKSL